MLVWTVEYFTYTQDMADRKITKKIIETQLLCLLVLSSIRDENIMNAICIHGIIFLTNFTRMNFLRLKRKITRGNGSNGSKLAHL